LPDFQDHLRVNLFWRHVTRTDKASRAQPIRLAVKRDEPWVGNTMKAQVHWECSVAVRGKNTLATSL